MGLLEDRGRIEDFGMELLRFHDSIGSPHLWIEVKWLSEDVSLWWIVVSYGWALLKFLRLKLIKSLEFLMFRLCSHYPIQELTWWITRFDNRTSITNFTLPSSRSENRVLCISTSLIKCSIIKVVPKRYFRMIYSHYTLLWKGIVSTTVYRVGTSLELIA